MPVILHRKAQAIQTDPAETVPNRLTRTTRHPSGFSFACFKYSCTDALVQSHKYVIT